MELSKELLSEVLNKNISSYEFDMYGNIDYKVINDYGSNINIYELSHKCKEWAYKQSSHNVGYAIKTVHYGDNVTGGFVGIEESYVDTCKTEFELVLKLCQWILDNKINKED